MPVVIKASLLALSTGVVCLGTCAPVLVPLFTAVNNDSLKNRYSDFFYFLLGRLFAYLLCGTLAALTGHWLTDHFIKPFSGWLLIFMAVVLILFGLMNGFPHLSFSRFALRFWPGKQVPLLFGVLLGLNPCPPFLTGLADVMLNGHIFYGLAFFFTFFVVTSLFLIPFMLFGFFARFKEMRMIGQLSALLSGVIYFMMGIRLLS
jgi:sulfite exporter TauE/SafE